MPPTANGSGYLDGLNAVGVRGTLKHFPGLGRVRTDTHLRPAILAASADDLAADWQPFRQLAGHPAAAIMLGHVTLSALDAEHPDAGAFIARCTRRRPSTHLLRSTGKNGQKSNLPNTVYTSAV